MENEGLAFYHSSIYKVCFPSHNVSTVKQKSVLISYVIAEITARINGNSLLLEENSFKQNASNEITMLQLKQNLFFFLSVMRFLTEGMWFCLWKAKDLLSLI